MADKEAAEKFIQEMLNRASEKEEPKQHLITKEADNYSAEKITENIRELIQKIKSQNCFIPNSRFLPISPALITAFLGFFLIPCNSRLTS